MAGWWIRRALVGRFATLAVAAAFPALASAEAPPQLTEATLERINARRAEAGIPALVASESLRRAAQAKARLLAEAASAFPSSRPEHLTFWADLDDLPDQLSAAEFEARRAKAHVVVADRSLEVDDLLGREAALVADLLDRDLRELGLGRTHHGELEILVAIIAVSKADDFSIHTRGLEDLAVVREQLLHLTNEERGRHGRAPLRADRCLERVAQRYAERMLERGFYGHYTPEGQDVLGRVRAGRCQQLQVAENLARGQVTPEQVVVSWVESPGHRENLLSGSYRRVGFGLAFGPMEDDHWILWVQVFG